MNKKTAVLATFLFLMTASFSSLASTVYYHGHGHGSGCGGGSGGSSGGGCTPTETYNEVFTTSTFTDIGHNKKSFSFDPLQSPGDGFTITSVLLTVTTSSNGFLDSIWAKDGAGPLDWEKVGHLSSSGTDVYSLDESLFDLVLNGIEFKAWFSLGGEDITSAMLTIDGVYCASTPVPLPGAVWLFGSAFAGLVGFSKRRKSQS